MRWFSSNFGASIKLSNAHRWICVHAWMCASINRPFRILTSVYIFVNIGTRIISKKILDLNSEFTAKSFNSSVLQNTNCIIDAIRFVPLFYNLYIHWDTISCVRYVFLSLCSLWFCKYYLIIVAVLLCTHTHTHTSDNMQIV